MNGRAWAVTLAMVGSVVGVFFFVAVCLVWLRQACQGETLSSQSEREKKRRRVKMDEARGTNPLLIQSLMGFVHSDRTVNV